MQNIGVTWFMASSATIGSSIGILKYDGMPRRQKRASSHFSTIVRERDVVGREGLT